MKNIVKYVFIILLILISGLSLNIYLQTKKYPDKIPSTFGYKIFIVLSDSMKGVFEKGDLVIVKEENLNNINTKDIISYKDDKNIVITHRIIKTIKNSNKKVFITKGDNNNVKDEVPISDKTIEGKYVASIKGLGNILLIMQKKITLIITLVLLLIFGIIWLFYNNQKNKNRRF